MPAYQFEALDAHGRSHAGTVQADSPRGVRAQLRERGLTSLSVVQVGGASSRGGGPHLGIAAQALMTRQLATLVHAGLPLEEALAALAEGSEPKTGALVSALRARVMEGATLAAALGEFPRMFDSLYCASVAAGEHSGRLGEVLSRLTAYLEGRDAMRRRLIGALAYPALLCLVALLVVGGLMLYVVPEVTAVFTRTGQALPWPTRMLLAISDGLRADIGWLLALSTALALGLAAVWRRPGFRRWRHASVLRLPLLGRLVTAVDFSRFARTLAMLGLSAVPLLEALQLAAEAVQNRLLREALDAAAVQVRAGAPLSRALERDMRFPPIAARLIANGERAGRLDSMLDEAADQLERELDTVTSVAMAGLGPVVILLVGALVLFIVLAILLPIFAMNQLIT
jgi:general secretion pathway protein F